MSTKLTGGARSDEHTQDSILKAVDPTHERGACHPERHVPGEVCRLAEALTKSVKRLKFRLTQPIHCSTHT